ncbi:hypothetical protein YC2023_061297 [Brassica napus]
MADGEKHALIPKKTIHQRFGLPDFSVVSNVFKKKQESEQSTAELALRRYVFWYHLYSVVIFLLKKTILFMLQLGIHPLDDDDDITVEQAWDDIVQRIKFLSADHPLGSHIRATLQRDGEHHGPVPLFVINAFDTKINNRYKDINPFIITDPAICTKQITDTFDSLTTSYDSYQYGVQIFNFG